MVRGKMRAFFAVVLTGCLVLTACFALAGCGAGGGKTEDAASSQSKKAAKKEKKPVEGHWSCVGVDLGDGKLLDAKDFEKSQGTSVSPYASLDLYEGGLAVLTMGEGQAAVATKLTLAEQDEKTYALTDPAAGEGSGSMTLAWKGDQLILTQTTTTTTSGAQTETTTRIAFAREGEAPVIIESFNVNYEAKDVLAMSNFMSFTRNLVVDDVVYGAFSKSEGSGEVMACAKLGKEKSGKAKIDDAKTIEDVVPRYLAQQDGYIYYVAYKDGTSQGIHRVKKGSTKAEVVYKGVASYLQAYDGKLFFTDEQGQWCCVDGKGKHKKTVLEKEVAYPYILKSGWFVYQDKADGQTLHLGKLGSDFDHKLTDRVSFNPVMAGGAIFFTTVNAKGSYFLCRLDTTTWKTVQGVNPVLQSFYVTETGVELTQEVSIEGWDSVESKKIKKLEEAHPYTDYRDGTCRIVRSYEGGDWAYDLLFYHDTNGSSAFLVV